MQFQADFTIDLYVHNGEGASALTHTLAHTKKK